MSKELAAAVLTRIYFDKVRNAEKPIKMQALTEPYSDEAIDHLGRVYSVFLGRLDKFASWSTEQPTKSGG